jgi:hypothetical protein
MTDRIDLDELAETDDAAAESGNRGDWLWRDDPTATEAGRTVDGDEGADHDPDAARSAADADAATPEDGSRSGAGSGTGADSTAGGTGDAVPHVPRSNRDRPAGVPESGGGAGAGAGTGSRSDREPDRGHGTAGERAERDTLGETGPHGGGVDDMTLAFTYRAARRLADPGAAVADAATWADWIGIVGDVPAHAINKFQREHAVDADFFNGSGTGPGERLADIGPHSMFYAERMVVVGVPGEEGVAERADWEFVPLPEAAEGAGWTLRDAGDG